MGCTASVQQIAPVVSTTSTGTAAAHTVKGAEFQSTVQNNPSQSPFDNNQSVQPTSASTVVESKVNDMSTTGSAKLTRMLSSASVRDEFHVRTPEKLILSVIVLGASGDLAKKKTYPALYALFSKGFLPKSVQIIGYARSRLSNDELRTKLREYLKGPAESIDRFLDLCTYMSGDYSSGPGYESLSKAIAEFEAKHKLSMVPEDASVSTSESGQSVGRLFYLALPPTTYPEVCAGLKKDCINLPADAAESWERVVLEKPFGKDLISSEALANQIGALFTEEKLYRIDHYLGKELVQSMLMMRFANVLFSSFWNRHHIDNVQISFKEPFGTEGRGGYFDQYGIIRDVIQNHLVQVLALLTMEPPVSMHPDDVRDEKVKVLRCIQPIREDDCVTGQYTAAAGQPGYLDDNTVPPGSMTPTFAAVKLFIHNDRWEGVPFFIKAGKALNERMASVRIQLRTPAIKIFGPMDDMRNELVIKFQPGEAIYAKLVVKRPGLSTDGDMTELDLSYRGRYKGIDIPDAYERLILDCICGDQQNFVRRDELRASWAIFTPLLDAIDRGEVKPDLYPCGSRGPERADALLKSCGFIKSKNYTYKSDEGATA